MFLIGKVGRVLITEASHKLFHQMYRKCSPTSFVQKTTKVQCVYWSKVTVVTDERTQTLDSRFCLLCLESTASYKCIRNSQPDQTGLVLKEGIQPRKTREGDAWGSTNDTKEVWMPPTAQITGRKRARVPAGHSSEVQLTHPLGAVCFLFKKTLTLRSACLFCTSLPRNSPLQ